MLLTQAIRVPQYPDGLSTLYARSFRFVRSSRSMYRAMRAYLFQMGYCMTRLLQYPYLAELESYAGGLHLGHRATRVVKYPARLRPGFYMTRLLHHPGMLRQRESH